MVMVVGVVACEPGNPCDEYVDYMCDCHPEVSCSDFELTYTDPDPNVQDECAVLLDEQEEEDAAAGDLCPVETTDTGTTPVE
jgi:hypothetical protein